MTNDAKTKTVATIGIDLGKTSFQRTHVGYGASCGHSVRVCRAAANLTASRLEAARDETVRAVRIARDYARAPRLILAKSR